MSTRPQIDHIVYGTHDLEQGIQAIEGLTGVRAEFGGAHESFGTHNALMSLGSSIYLEIIAPDLSQPKPQTPRPFGIDDLKQPGLVGWVAHTNDIEAQVAASIADGYNPGDVVVASRTKPDGGSVSWKLTVGDPLFTGGAVPFLIDWRDADSPALSTPKGCEFLSLEIYSSEADHVNNCLKALQLDIRAQPSERFELSAEIMTPKGKVKLS